MNGEGKNGEKIKKREKWRNGEGEEESVGKKNGEDT